MEPDVLLVDGSYSSQHQPAPSMRPLISGNRAATIRHLSTRPRPLEIRAPAIREIRVYCCIRRGCASNAFPLAAQVDAGICVSSVTTLTVSGRINVPAFF